MCTISLTKPVGTRVTRCTPEATRPPVDAHPPAAVTPATLTPMDDDHALELWRRPNSWGSG